MQTVSVLEFNAARYAGFSMHAPMGCVVQYRAQCQLLLYDHVHLQQEILLPRGSNMCSTICACRVVTIYAVQYWSLCWCSACYTCLMFKEEKVAVSKYQLCATARRHNQCNNSSSYCTYCVRSRMCMLSDVCNTIACGVPGQGWSPAVWHC